jgi:4-hydroxy-tetrahydrodipicolinate reductase
VTAPPPMRVAVLGARGRLGSLVVHALTARCEPRPVVRGDDLNAVLTHVSCVIDVTTAGNTPVHARACAVHRRPLLVATTGLSADDERALDDAAQTIPVLVAANLSVSAHRAAQVVRELARAWPQADIEVVETHHRNKKDAPSGTALMLARAAAAGRAQGDEAFKRARDGHAPRAPGEIGISAVRGGDVVGEHAVTFFGDGERIELVHRVSDRAIFARGAVTAIEWLSFAGRKPGRYGMSDVVGG